MRYQKNQKDQRNQKDTRDPRDKKFTYDDIDIKLQRVQFSQNRIDSLSPDIPDIIKDTSVQAIQENIQYQNDIIANQVRLQEIQSYEDFDFIQFQRSYNAYGSVSTEKYENSNVGETTYTDLSTADNLSKIRTENGIIDLNKIAKVESNNNYNAINPTSGAYGKYQFLESTGNYIADKYGVNDWKTPKGQEKLMAYFTQENTKVLQKHGYSTNTLNVYALHQQGAGGGIKLLKAFDSGDYKGESLDGTLKRNIINNTPEKYRTGEPVADWYNYWYQKLMI